MNTETQKEIEKNKEMQTGKKIEMQTGKKIDMQTGKKIEKNKVNKNKNEIMQLEYPIHEAVFVKKTAKSCDDPNFYIVKFMADPVIDEFLTQCVLTHDWEDELLELVHLSKKKLEEKASKCRYSFGLEELRCFRKEYMKACKLLHDHLDDLNLKKLSIWELIFLIMLAHD